MEQSVPAAHYSGLAQRARRNSVSTFLSSGYESGWFEEWGTAVGGWAGYALISFELAGAPSLRVCARVGFLSAYCSNSNHGIKQAPPLKSIKDGAPKVQFQKPGHMPKLVRRLIFRWAAAATRSRVRIRSEFGWEQVEQRVHRGHGLGVFGHQLIGIGRSGAHVRDFMKSFHGHAFSLVSTLALKGAGSSLMAARKPSAPSVYS